jgi:hypothetical protein
MAASTWGRPVLPSSAGPVRALGCCELRLDVTAAQFAVADLRPIGAIGQELFGPAFKASAPSATS